MAIGLSAGTAWLAVKPDLRGLHRKIKAEVAGINAEVRAEADTKAARSELDETARDRSANITADVDQRSAASASTLLDRVSRDRRSRVAIDVDTSGIGRANRLLGDSASIANRSSLTFGQLAVAAGTLGAALIPVAAAAGGLVAALSAPLAAAGGGLTVWGLLAGGAVSKTNEQLKDIDTARKKLAGLEKGTKEYAAAQADLKSKLAALTPAQRAFRDSLDGVKAAMSTLVTGRTGSALLGPLAKGLDLVAVAMRKSKPLIVAVGGALTDLLGQVGKAVRGPAFKGFVDFFAKAAPPAIKAFARIAANVAIGIGGLVRAFAPLGNVILGGIVRLTDRFAAFGRTANKDDGVRGFMDYVRSIGPSVATFFEELWKAAGKLIRAFAPIGEVVLAGLTGMFRLINKMPTDVLTSIAAGIIAATVAFKGLSLAMSIAAAGPAGLLTIGLAAVAAGLILAYKRVEWFRKGVDAVFGFVKKHWKPILIGIAAAVALLPTALVLAYKKSEKFRKIVNGAFDAVKTAARAVGKAAKWLWSEAIQPAFKAISKFVRTELMPIFRRLWHKVIKPVFKGIGTVIKDAWNGVIKPLLKAFWWYVKNVVAPIYKWLWKNVVKPAFITIGKVIKAAWQHVIKPALNVFIGFFDKVLFPVIRTVYGVVRGAFKRVGGAIKWAWSNIISPAFDVFKSGFRKIGDVFEGIGRVITGVWDSVKSGVVSAINWIIDRINDFISVTNDAIDGLNKMPGVDISHIGTIEHITTDNGEDPAKGVTTGRGNRRDQHTKIPLYAQGGFVTRPTLAMVGEGKEAEAILPRSVMTGLMGRAAAVGVASSGGGRGTRSLVSALWALVRELRKQIADTTRPSGSGTGRPTLDGVHTGGARRKDFLGGVDVRPQLEGFNKGFKKQIQVAQSWEQAVGKSAKRAGKFWTEVRYGPFRKFSDDWKKRLRIAGQNSNEWEKTLGKNARQSGRVLQGFTRGSLSPFAKDFGQKFTRDLPSDLASFRSKTTSQFGKTSDSMRGTWSNRVKPMLREFGGYPKGSVAPAFGKGVDAIGGQWDKVRKATGKPVKFVVETVLNKGLLKAFNKIAKFVDTDTIKDIALPKFDVGGFTGHGGKYEPAGIVHKGEWVIPKESTTKIRRERPGLLEGLTNAGNDRRMSPPRKKLPGYWLGGGVLPLPSATSISPHGVPYYGAWYAADMNGPYDNTSRGKIVSWKDGIVAAVKQSGSSYGNETVINHADGNYTRYAHQLAQFVRGGQKVRAGQRIGLVGETGNADGAHLHFEIEGGKASPTGGTGIGIGMPTLPQWAQQIVNAPTKWARGLLGDKLAGGGFAALGQGLLDQLIKPAASWAVDQLGTGLGATGVASGEAQKYAKSRMKRFGWGANQWPALKELWDRESGWNYQADNPDSSAYGIPQGLVDLHNLKPPYYGRVIGPSHYAGGDPGTQINWGMKYIAGRYKTPAAALAYHNANNSYDLGGVARGVGLLPKLTPHPERVLSPHETANFDRMIDRNFRPDSAAVFPDRISIQIDDWERGKGFIDGRAARQQTRTTKHRRRMAAMR